MVMTHVCRVREDSTRTLVEARSLTVHNVLRTGQLPEPTASAYSTVILVSI